MGIVEQYVGGVIEVRFQFALVIWSVDRTTIANNKDEQQFFEIHSEGFPAFSRFRNGESVGMAIVCLLAISSIDLRSAQIVQTGADRFAPVVGSFLLRLQARPPWSATPREMQSYASASSTE